MTGVGVEGIGSGKGQTPGDAKPWGLTESARLPKETVGSRRSIFYVNRHLGVITNLARPAPGGQVPASQLPFGCQSSHFSDFAAGIERERSQIDGMSRCPVCYRRLAAASPCPADAPAAPSVEADRRGSLLPPVIEGFAIAQLIGAGGVGAWCVAAPASGARV